MMSEYDCVKIIDAPLYSEKSTKANFDRTYAFKVEKTATKMQIKLAVQTLFNVEVESVHVLNVKGKVKRFGRMVGKRSDWKKAYVKLKAGHNIELATA